LRTKTFAPVNGTVPLETALASLYLSRPKISYKQQQAATKQQQAATSRTSSNKQQQAATSSDK
jgi:hypothetical protein